VHDILASIQPCSVRAVAYQLFTRGLIPSMEKTIVGAVTEPMRCGGSSRRSAWPPSRPVPAA
jgi:hypothetical protein